MKKSENTPFRIVGDPAATGVIGPQPSRSLGDHGQRLWDRGVAEYEVTDVAGIELLTQACAAVDRAEALAAHIAEDGEIIRTRNGIKAHPAIREELACRGFIVRTLQKLGLNYEPLRAAPGRPARSLSMTTKRTVLTRRPRRIDPDTLSLFCRLDAIPAQRRPFSDGGRELARRLGLISEWWTGNSVLDRSDAPHHSPEYAAFEDWRTCRAAREALLGAVRSRGASLKSG